MEIETPSQKPINGNPDEFGVIYSFDGSELLWAPQDLFNKYIVADSTMIIAEGAFGGCLLVENIQLPQGLQIIKNGAFYNCKKLQTINIPSSIQEIGDSAFEGCVSLNKLILNENIKVLGNEVFANCETLEEFELPAKLEDFGANLFRNCTNLHRIVFHSILYYLDSKIFQGCNSLNDIIIKEPKSQYRVVDGVVYSADLQSIIYCPAGIACGQYQIEDGVTSISDGAFSDCINLVSISIPSSVETIGDNVWKNCLNLNEIKVASNGNFVFENGILYSSEHRLLIKCILSKDITSIEIPQGVEQISESAFRGCRTLESIDIKAYITKLPRYVFANCVHLKHISLPNVLEQIAEGAFAGCTSLEDVFLPESVDYIGNEAFSDCVSLKKIILPSQLVTISKRLFLGCETIEQIDIPETITCIENEAFCGCSRLCNFDFPQNLREIRPAAFAYTALIAISIPRMVEKIGAYAFAYCNDLQIASVSKETDADDTIFEGCTNLATIAQ